jgi:hypothetical protein
MSDAMKQQFGLIQRPWGISYRKNKITGEQTSLKTRDRVEAARLLQAHNETQSQPHFSRALAQPLGWSGPPQSARRQSVPRFPPFAGVTSEEAADFSFASSRARCRTSSGNPTLTVALTPKSGLRRPNKSGYRRSRSQHTFRRLSLSASRVVAKTCADLTRFGWKRKPGVSTNARVF